MIAKVNALKTTQPDQFKELMYTLRDTSEGLYEILEEPKLDYYAFWDYISLSQVYLQELGVSSPEIDKIVATVMPEECHAKLTGAGGGGCVLVFP